MCTKASVKHTTNSMYFPTEFVYLQDYTVSKTTIICTINKNKNLKTGFVCTLFFNIFVTYALSTVRGNM